MNKLVSLLAIAFMVLMSACGSRSMSSSAEHSVAIGEPIELVPGDTLTLGDDLSKPVVVDFWADWCPRWC